MPKFIVATFGRNKYVVYSPTVDKFWSPRYGCWMRWNADLRDVSHFFWPTKYIARRCISFLRQRSKKRIFAAIGDE